MTRCQSSTYRSETRSPVHSSLPSSKTAWSQHIMKQQRALLYRINPYFYFQCTHCISILFRPPQGKWIRQPASRPRAAPAEQDQGALWAHPQVGGCCPDPCPGPPLVWAWCPPYSSCSPVSASAAAPRGFIRQCRRRQKWRSWLHAAPGARWQCCALPWFSALKALCTIPNLGKWIYS